VVIVSSAQPLGCMVHTGVCWAFAAVAEISPWHAERFGATRFFHIGLLSLALFAINVSAIFAVSVAIFRFKGIRPIRRQLLNWEVLPPSLRPAASPLGGVHAHKALASFSHHVHVWSLPLVARQEADAGCVRAATQFVTAVG
jgi:hypothetical protein